MPDGSTNSFVELRTGLGRWSDVDGGWVLASMEIEQVNGVFLSRKTQYQAILATNATASEGTIDLQMVNGARFRVRPMGIAYTEIKNGQPGRSVFVAELQSSDYAGPGKVPIHRYIPDGWIDLDKICPECIKSLQHPVADALPSTRRLAQPVRRGRYAAADGGVDEQLLRADLFQLQPGLRKRPDSFPGVVAQ
ncbi:MAG: hypothetical protein DME19_05730 [Verrucomicrobia bacterium]|nr:MAG: hypothetical protein DME19_05730 [Verrucomicrobiota bacterium]